MVLRNKKLKDLEFFRVKIMLPWDPQETIARQRINRRTQGRTSRY